MAMISVYYSQRVQYLQFAIVRHIPSLLPVYLTHSPNPIQSRITYRSIYVPEYGAFQKNKPPFPKKLQPV